VIPVKVGPSNTGGDTLRLINPDGSVVDVQLTEGQVIPAPVGEHAVENVGQAEVQTICIELKT
jgi:hypothetical protein